MPRLNMTDLAEHIEKCKQRALKELNENGIVSALTQLGEEFKEHDEIAGLHYWPEMMCEMGAKGCRDVEEARTFIHQFHKYWED
jgi:hypothetical protein